jgi:hypothetical protein
MSTVSIDLRKRSRGIGWVFGGLALMLLVGWFAGAITLETCHAHGGAFCFRFERAVAMVRDFVDRIAGG